MSETIEVHGLWLDTKAGNRVWVGYHEETGTYYVRLTIRGKDGEPDVYVDSSLGEEGAKALHLLLGQQLKEHTSAAAWTVSVWANLK